MIDFNVELVFRGLQILKEDDDFFDMKEDLENTKRIMKQVQYSVLMLIPDPAEQIRRLQEANNQDQYLRKKYPDIEEMLYAAEMLSKVQGRASSHSKAPETNEYKLLEQDCYGIVLHVLKKKGIVTRVEEYIERVT